MLIPQRWRVPSKPIRSYGWGMSPFSRASSLPLVFAIGALTALLGAGMMLTQNDIKKTLGYSTIGQMGYMIMECGLGAFALAIFHLIAHGLFKATIFLNCGHVIHAARQEPRLPPKDETVEQTDFSLLTWLTGFITTLILPLIILLAAHGVLSLPFRNSQGVVIFLFFQQPPLCGCPRSQTRAGLHARGPSAGYEQALPVCRRSDRPWPGPACGGLDGGTVGCKHHPIFCCCSHDPSVSPAWGLRGRPDPSARIFAPLPCHPAADRGAVRADGPSSRNARGVSQRRERAGIVRRPLWVAQSPGSVQSNSPVAVRQPRLLFHSVVVSGGHRDLYSPAGRLHQRGGACHRRAVPGMASRAGAVWRPRSEPDRRGGAGPRPPFPRSRPASGRCPGPPPPPSLFPRPCPAAPPLPPPPPGTQWLPPP